MQPFELPDFYIPWPARLNPNLQAARAHSKAWARQVGILDPDSPQIWDESSFDRHDYALFCSYIHPEASAEELNLMTEWNVWAFYVDDYFLKVYKQTKDRAGAKKYLQRMLLFMPSDLGPTPPPIDPIEHGLTNLWQRTAPSKSKAWRLRIIGDTRSLLETSLLEVDGLIQQRSANPIEYIEFRRQVGGALWSADLVEHAMGIEIPERIAASRSLRVLKETFADAVHLRNDIFSYEREVLKEGELTNAVLVVERFMQVDIQQAVNLVNDLLNARLEQFEHTIRTELEPLFAEYQVTAQERESVAAYIRGLRDWQSGGHEWHIQTSRYLNPRAAQGLTARKFRSGPTGLGTAAAQIMGNPLRPKKVKNDRHVSYQRVEPIRFPEFYMPFTNTMNPNLEIARQHSKAWARQMGMLDRLSTHPYIIVWDERRFDAANIAFFCALAYPSATIAELNLATRWLVWATYIDDYFAEVFGHKYDLAGAENYRARLWKFMPVDEFTPPSLVPRTPAERGLAELWACTTAALSIDARHQFRNVIDGLFASWLWELTNRMQNHIPEMVDYIEMRRKTSGADFMLVFIRSVKGSGLLPEIYNTHTMQELNNTAGDHVYLINDIVSYQKEIEFEGDIHNVVLVIQNLLGCKQEQAIEIANKLMTTRMQQFEHIVANDLPLLFDDFNIDAKGREELLDYVKELKHLMYASVQWHTSVDRYKEPQLRRTMRVFTGGPTGLGTSAARILESIGRG